MDLATAQKHLQYWLDADLAASTGQAWSAGGRSLSRQSAESIRESVNYWQRVVNQLSAAASGARNPGVRIAVVT